MYTHFAKINGFIYISLQSHGIKGLQFFVEVPFFSQILQQVKEKSIAGEKEALVLPQ